MRWCFLISSDAILFASKENEHKLHQNNSAVKLHRMPEGFLNKVFRAKSNDECSYFRGLETATFSHEREREFHASRLISNTTNILLLPIKMVNFVFTVTQTSMPLLTAQIAFKDLMIHRHVQFTLRIAFRCVLHRPASQDIHCQKLCLLLMCVFSFFFFSSSVLLILFSALAEKRKRRERERERERGKKKN
jgi:hypothetical protein